jgi:hypothetical protein
MAAQPDELLEDLLILLEKLDSALKAKGVI